MSATVQIDEIDPETREKVLQQIEGNTALATIESIPFYTPAKMRARSILSPIDSISSKLETFEVDIRLAITFLGVVSLCVVPSWPNRKKPHSEKRTYQDLAPYAVRHTAVLTST
jgi:hypothetical protein